MRVRRTIMLGTTALLTGVALVACFDLLHSTADIVTACDVDSGHPGCGPSATADQVDTDFCAWTAEQARQHALHACAWLGACEAPMGNNAFGSCSFRALMAYDCAANPNHRPHNAVHRSWDCLQRAQSCGDVDVCVFGDAGLPVCMDPGSHTACAGSAVDANVRVRCADGGAQPYPKAAGENCALWGQTCAAAHGESICAGGPSCAVQECSRRSIHWCSTDADGGPGLDVGIDCADNGAMDCGGFPSRDTPQWVACNAEGDAAPGTDRCIPDASATCQEGHAVSCPSGVVESLDCATLLGSKSACTEGPLAPPFDWTSRCALPSVDCTTDSCNGTMLTSCERGAHFGVDCKNEELGPCRLLAADPGSAPRAACTPLVR